MDSENKHSQDADSQYYFSPTTGEVTQGKKQGWDNRMGPYSSAEEARNALKTARERTQAADAEAQADDSWGKPASWE